MKRFGFAVTFLALCVSVAGAEEILGVRVYPGAKLDPGTTASMKSMLSVDGAAYRTTAGVAQVTAFYRKEGLLFLRTGEPSKERARLQKTDGSADVVIQNPWKDPRTGAVMHDTLIMIIRQRPEPGDVAR